MSGLKVYLSLETKQFRRGLRQADRLVQKASKRIGRYGMMGAAALVGIGMKSVQMYGEQEAAVNALTSALATNGDNVTRLIPQYKAFAAEIQQQTVFGDEAILGMMAQIRNLGVMPDKLEEATKGAIGLSKALGMNAESAARYTALALKGEMTMLQRYIPALRQATTEAEKTALVHDMMAKGFKQAQAEAETTRGGFTQLKNAAGDMAEAIGGVIVETLTLNTQTGSLKDTVTEWSDTIQKRGPETAFMLQSGFIEVKTALFNTWDTTKIVTENMITGFKNVGEGIGIFASNMVDDMTGSFKWLKDNWWTVLTNMHNLSGETWKSIAKLAADTMLASIRVMGGQLKDMWKAAATKSIPALLRSMTPIDNMVDELGRLKDSANDVLAGISTDLNLKEFKLKGADGAFDKLLDPDQYESVTDAIAENEAKKKQELLDAEALYRKRLLDREAKEKEDAPAPDDGAPGGPGDKRERTTMADQFTKIGAYMAGATETKSDGLLTRQVTLQQQMAGYLKLLASRGYETGSFI